MKLFSNKLILICNRSYFKRISGEKNSYQISQVSAKMIRLKQKKKTDQFFLLFKKTEIRHIKMD